MENEIKEYANAIEAHIKACRDETLAKQIKKQTYYRVMRAKDELRSKERELLEDKVE